MSVTQRGRTAVCSQLVLLLFASSGALTACYDRKGGGDQPSSRKTVHLLPGQPLGADQTEGPTAEVDPKLGDGPAPAPAEPASAPEAIADAGAGDDAGDTDDAHEQQPHHLHHRRVVGESCHQAPHEGDRESDTNFHCLALKYVSYIDSNGDPVVSEQQAIENVRKLNQLYAGCKIAFQIDAYLAVDPKQHSLRFNTADQSELADIRSEFANDRTFLVVTTGEWDRRGSIGSTGANAWTQMPGGRLHGAILESKVGAHPQILAHELGHYLNLDHAGDRADLMNSIVYSNSTALDEDQCRTMRAAAVQFWSAMYR